MHLHAMDRCAIVRRALAVGDLNRFEAAARSLAWTVSDRTPKPRLDARFEHMKRLLDRFWFISDTFVVWRLN